MPVEGPLEGRIGRHHRDLPGGGDGAVVLGIGDRSRARRRIPAVGIRPGRADERRAGGLRRSAASPARSSASPTGSIRAASSLRRLRSAPAANALLLVVDPTSAIVPVLRVVTGACMAGVYPVGMKLASTWAKGDMGLMVGILVGALTLGSASPHLFNALGGVDWRIPLALASVSALVAAVLVLFAGVGPNRAPSPRFDPRIVASRVARRSAAAREPGLSRAHVGALRDVGVDRRLPRRELCADAAGRRTRRRSPSWPRLRPSRQVRSARSAPASLPTGSAARRSRSRRWP